MVWSEKGETDRCYDECAELLLDQVSPPSGPDSPPKIGLLFGTHNKESCDVVMNGLVKRGLVSEGSSKSDALKVPRWVSGQVQLGQLLGNTFRGLLGELPLTMSYSAGMADELTNYIACRLDCEGAPMVLKCVPYGKLEDVSTRIFDFCQTNRRTGHAISRAACNREQVSARSVLVN